MQAIGTGVTPVQAISNQAQVASSIQQQQATLSKQQQQLGPRRPNDRETDDRRTDRQRERQTEQTDRQTHGTYGHTNRMGRIESTPQCYSGDMGNANKQTETQGLARHTKQIFTP